MKVNKSKFLPLTKVLRLVFCTLFILQALTSASQQSNGLRCYECSFSQQDPSYLQDGFTPKCYNPDKEMAPSKVCTPPDDQSCGKEHQIFRFESGAVIHNLARGCTNIPANPKEWVTLPLKKEDYNRTRQGKEMGTEKQSSSPLKLKLSRNRSKRDVDVGTMYTSGYGYYCKEKDNCNNEAGVEIKESPCFTCSRTSCSSSSFTNQLIISSIFYSTHFYI